jgi:uncharacterized protein involved in exopolysaccharide biosynthesis
MSPRQLFLILLRRSWIIAVMFVATMIGAGVLLYFVPPRYDAQATATIDPASADPVTGQSVGATGLRVQQGNLAALAKSQRVAVEVVKRLNLTGNPTLMAQYRNSYSVGRVDAADWIASELLKNLDARFNEGTNVLVVTYKSSSPILAAQVANTFLAAFTDAAIDAKVSGAQQTAQWFEPQTDKMRAEVDEARIKMSRFQTKEKLAPTGNGDSDVGALQQITSDLSQARAEAVKVQSTLTQWALAPEDSSEAQPLDTPLMQSLKTSLSSTTAEISRLQATVGAKNPKLLALFATQKSLRVQIASERRETRQNLETRLKTLQAQIATLDAARNEQISKVIGIQEQREELAMLARDLEVKQDRYVAASKASASARLQAQLSFSNISVLDKAPTPVSPAFPKPMLVIPAAIAAGLGLGCIFALIAEALNRRIRVARDLEFAAMAPNLGVMLSAPVRRLDRRQHRLAALKAPG